MLAQLSGLMPSPATAMFYTTSFRLSLKGLNTTPTATSTQLRHPLSNWSSHGQELHATHAILELILGIRLIVIQLY